MNPQQPELKGPGSRQDREETLARLLDSASGPSELPREAQLEAPHRAAFGGVGHMGIPGGFLLDPVSHPGVLFRAGLGSQGPVATGNGSLPLTTPPQTSNNNNPEPKG